jgi:hypothetical protein
VVKVTGVPRLVGEPMDADWRLQIHILDGPESRRGERSYPGDSVVLAASASEAQGENPPQVCTVSRVEDGMALSPGPGAHLRVGPGAPWRGVAKVGSDTLVPEGQVIYLGPIKRGLTIQLLGFRSAPLKMAPIPTPRFRGGVGLAVLAFALFGAWLVASASY